MTRRENVPLASLTTFKAGGHALYACDCETIEDVRSALAYAKEKNVPFRVIGEGSNVLPSDKGFDGLILLMRIGGIEFHDEGERMRVIAGAGVRWDDLVREAATRGLWGLENLAGIPGTVGAAPVQNIGAYGADLSQTLNSVEVLSAATGELQHVPAADCGFGYRDSRFKHEPDLVIVRVTFNLAKEGTPKIAYGDLQKAKEAGTDLSTPTAIGEAVRTIRAGKFPDLALYGTAGSFFKNPVVSEQTYQALRTKFGEVPSFPAATGVKIPLAFILDRVLSLRGFRLGNAWLFGSQPLVLVLDLGGSSAEIEALAQLVESKVKEATEITIEREVRSLP